MKYNTKPDIKDKTYRTVLDRKCSNCGYNKLIFSRSPNFYAYLTCIRCQYTQPF